MTQIDRTQLLAQAEAELRSAYTLVADPQCDPLTVMPHLLRAWQTLACSSRGELPEGVGEDLSAWLAPEHLELIPSGKRDELFASLRSASELVAAPPLWTEQHAKLRAELPRPRKLVGQLRTLDKLRAAIAEQAGGRSLARQRALRWAARITVAVVGVGAFVLLALRPWQSEDIGPWRAAYYPSRTLEGEPELRREIDLGFDWGYEPPTDSIPADDFSARFDTCLVLDEDTEVTFMLVSDDGARLLVDGDKRIDNWARRGSKIGSDRISLAAGVHHLRVEYYERSAKAKLHLTASFDEREAPKPIPAQLLEFPGLELEDDKHPCAGVR